MTPSTYRSWLEDQLKPIIPDERERGWVLRALLEDGPDHPDDPAFYQWAASAIDRLRLGAPVQYITGKAHFFGMELNIDSHTLIPRPETEELVDLTIRVLKRVGKETARILDIGTGSGCIALSLKHQLPNARIQAWDISADAIAVAQANARKYDLDIEWKQTDALQKKSWSNVNNIDLIISNPPYIAPDEQCHMDHSVVTFEPHMALFAAGDDPLIFYRILAEQGHAVLRTGGMITCECSAYSAREVARIFAKAGYQEVDVIQDLQGLDRFCLAVWMD